MGFSGFSAPAGHKRHCLRPGAYHAPTELKEVGNAAQAPRGELVDGGDSSSALRMTRGELPAVRRGRYTPRSGESARFRRRGICGAGGRTGVRPYGMRRNFGNARSRPLIHRKRSPFSPSLWRRGEGFTGDERRARGCAPLRVRCGGRAGARPYGCDVAGARVRAPTGAVWRAHGCAPLRVRCGGAQCAPLRVRCVELRPLNSQFSLLNSSAPHNVRR